MCIRSRELGDGGGLASTGTVWNTRVYRLTGQPPGHALELLPHYPPAPFALQHWYGYGLIAIEQRLYKFLCYLEHGQWHGVGNHPGGSSAGRELRWLLLPVGRSQFGRSAPGDFCSID